MAIAYVGGATNSTGTGTATTLTITYTSTTGNAMYLAILAFNGTSNITSVTDSASNGWTLTGGTSTGIAATNSGSSFIAFTTSNAPTGVTTVTIHATTATNICAVLGEYSGVTTTQYSGGTAWQTGLNINGTGTTFTSSMIGGTIVFSNGATAPITSFSSTTNVLSTTSQTVSSTPGIAFTIFYPATATASPISTGAQTVLAGNWLISHLMAQTSNAVPVFTAATGTLRNQATMTLPAGYGFAGVALVDNTTGTSLTDSANFTGTYLTAVAAAQKTT